MQFREETPQAQVLVLSLSRSSSAQAMWEPTFNADTCLHESEAKQFLELELNVSEGSAHGLGAVVQAVARNDVR
jgi:hypothetical protein